MKKTGWVLAFSVFALACSSSKAQNASSSDKDGKQSEAVTKKDNNKRVDPVCGMPEGKIAYTDFSVYQKDTVWFCSPHCKEQFDKNPAKYTKN